VVTTGHRLRARPSARPDANMSPWPTPCQQDPSCIGEYGGLRISRLGEGLLEGGMTESMPDGMADAAYAQLALREKAEGVEGAPAPPFGPQ